MDAGIVAPDASAGAGVRRGLAAELSVGRRSARISLDCPLDLVRECQVLVGDSAGAVGLEFDAHARPCHAQVGMVVGGFGDEGDGIDEQHGLRPAVGFVVSADPSVLEVPTGDRSELLVDLSFGVGRFAAAHGRIRKEGGWGLGPGTGAATGVHKAS
jgi:hypothetical protein